MKYLNLKFLKKIQFIVFLFMAVGISFGQQHNNASTAIKGQIIENKKDGDTIFFSNGIFNKKYFQTNSISAGIKNKNFTLHFDLAYPQLYMISYRSERNKIAYRDGFYFFDSTTSTIKVDSIGDCSVVNGKTALEFKEKFIPFLFKDSTYSCKRNDFSRLVYQETSKFDQKLLEYIQLNPDSYVALWFLIERIGANGFSKLNQQNLEAFSHRMQQEKLWEITSHVLENIKIRKDEKFPHLLLKTVDFQKKQLILPKGKYTLVDFWFHNCKPCLKSFLTLKKLYKEYHSKGFNIVGISVDKTKYIKKWQEVIEDKKLSWPQYLDENALKATQEKITAFPTAILLNARGEVIQKDIYVNDLKKFLEKNM